MKAIHDAIHAPFEKDAAEDRSKYKAYEYDEGFRKAVEELEVKRQR